MRLASSRDAGLPAAIADVVQVIAYRLAATSICLFREDAAADIALLYCHPPAGLAPSVVAAHRAEILKARQSRATTTAQAHIAAAAGDMTIISIRAEGDTFDLLLSAAPTAHCRVPDAAATADVAHALRGIAAAVIRSSCAVPREHRDPSLPPASVEPGLTAAVDGLDQAIALYDHGGRLTYCNDQFRRFFHDDMAATHTHEDLQTLFRSRANQTHAIRQLVMGRDAVPGALHAADLLTLADGRVVTATVAPNAGGGHVVTCGDITGTFQIETRLRTAIDGADVGTWEWTLASGRNLINDRWAEMLGYRRDELEPVTIDVFARLVVPDDLAAMRLAWEGILTGKSDRFEREFRMYHKNGHQVWVLSRGRVTAVGPDGLPTALAGMHLEITQLKLAQERLTQLTDGAQIGTWDWDLVTDEQRGNQQWAAMLGYSLDEVSPMTYERWRDLVHPDDIDLVERNMEHCVSGTADSFVAEYRMQHKDGSWIWMIDRAKVIARMRDGRATFIAGIQIEISEQKAREEALRAAKTDLELAFADRKRAEQRLADIAAVSQDWFWEQDADLRFQFFSHMAFLGAGTDPKAGLLGMRWQDWLADRPIERASADWPKFFKQLDDWLPFRDFVFMLPPQGDAETRWVRFSGTPIFDENGAFSGYRGVGSDVTQHYLAKSRAEEANQSKSIFLANMSHEIRTPLNGVLGMAEVLDFALVDPHHKRMIATIRDSGEALLSILNDILDMSKIEARKLQLELLPFDPAELAARVEELHRLRADEKGLSFDVVLGMGAERPRIGDPHRLRQILNNLISNAIKFTEKGHVSVCFKGKPGQPFVIEVSDTGIGMTAEQLAHVHDEFVQADSSITRKYGGTGLGMAITRSLVEMMNGQMTVTSEVGVGTTMVIALPLAIDAAPRGPDVQENDRAIALTGRHVLIADDNETNCMVLGHLLRHLGATSVSTKDGSQALAAWDQGTFDALLLDIAMPVMDGKAAVQKIRERESLTGRARTPVIAVTANVMPYQISQYLSLGFDACIGKPISSKDLAHAIHSLLETG